MWALFEVLLWMFLMPWLIVAGFIGAVINEIRRTFQPQLLMGAMYCGLLGLYLVPRGASDDAVFVGVVDAIAELAVGGIRLPFVMIAGATALLIAAFVARVRQPAT